jgi:DNA-binding CsgD family transcriptional regulator
MIKKINNRSLSIMIFSLYFSWLLAVPFEGQVLYAFGNKYELNVSLMVFGSIAVHFIGLISSGFFIKSENNARTFMLFSIVFVIIGNSVFFFSPSFFWYASLVITSFLAGGSVAAWGFFYKKFTPYNERLKTAADVLIYSNILMITLNMTAIHLSPEIGLVFAQILLAMALFFVFKLPVGARTDKKSHLQLVKSTSSSKPLISLCVFIFLLTINSGLMYHVINPAFVHLKSIVSWYWAVPYIIAIYIIRNLPARINRTYLLFIAIAMVGLAFLFFMILDHSAPSYFLVNTLMLGACGVFDIFWWSILGAMLDFYNNPAKILGLGLSANVLGVLTGGMVGNVIVSMSEQRYNPSVLALIIVFTVLIMLPLLHKQLSLFLKKHIFLSPLLEMSVGEENEQVKTMNILMTKSNLTDREKEIIELLLKGRTYKLIAGELQLSENTVKTHIKNIYSKFNVQSKTELIKRLEDKEQSLSGQ